MTLLGNGQSVTESKSVTISEHLTVDSCFCGSNSDEPRSKCLETIHRTVKKGDAFVEAGGGTGRGGRQQREPVQQPGAAAEAAHQEDGRTGQSGSEPLKLVKQCLGFCSPD